MNREQIEQEAYYWKRNSPQIFTLEDAYIGGAESRQPEIDKLVDQLKWARRKMGNHSIMEGDYDELDQFLIENDYE